MIEGMKELQMNGSTHNDHLFIFSKGKQNCIRNDAAERSKDVAIPFLKINPETTEYAKARSAAGRCGIG